MKPLKKALNEAVSKKEGLEVKLKDDNTRVRDCMGRAKVHSQKIEKLEEDVDGVEEQLDEIERKERDRP